MIGEITGLCRDHSFERADDLCRMCGAEFCEVCLVHPSGTPLCKACAIAAAGVRSGGAHKPLNKREIKKRLKAFETARALRRNPEETAPILVDPIAGHDPIGPPPGKGMERLGESNHVAPDPDLVAQAAARLAGADPAPDELDEPDDPQPGDIAPPIDWNNPFG